MKNKKHGYGKLTVADSVIYKGEWLQDEKHGKGKFITTKGDVYKG